MANSSVQYVGDNATATFSIPFPYIAATHIIVEVDDVVQTSPNMYSIPTPGSVVFGTAPGTDAVVKIRRSSSIDTRLVDYQNGAVLTEDELDLDSQQAFYLAQEITENYSDLINESIIALATANGLVVTDPTAVIDQLVQNVLSDALAATLQARIVDIDTNAQNVLALTTTVDGHTASISSNATVIATAQGDITTLEALYGVTLNVNGYVTGFAQHNNGTTGTFQILADKFYIVDPANDGQNPVIPFAVSGGIVSMQNVVVSGSLLAGTIEALRFQTASSGQRIILDEATNEALFYGDKGNGSIAKLATIGITDYAGDNVIGYFGSTNASHSNTAIVALTNSGAAAVSAHSISGTSVYATTNSTNTSKSGVNGIALDRGYGVRGEAYGSTAWGVRGEAGPNAAGGVLGVALSGNTSRYGVSAQHLVAGGVPLFIEKDPSLNVPAAGVSEGSVWLSSNGNFLMAYVDGDWQEIGPNIRDGEETTPTGANHTVTTAPANCKRITIAINQLSTTGTSPIVIRLRDTAVKATGYNAGGAFAGTSTDGWNESTGFQITGNTWNATFEWTGIIKLEREDKAANRWVCSFQGSAVNSTYSYQGAGVVTLASEIEGFRLTTVGGSDTFDSGNISVVYER